MVVVNRVAAFAWAFSAFFLLVVAAFTFLLIRDGPPPGYSATASGALLAAFWLVGLGLAAYASSRPQLRVSMEPGGVTVVTWRYPLRRLSRTVPPEQLGSATVVRSQDDEGEPYYSARVALADGTAIDLLEGHDRDSCDAVCRRFNESLARHRGLAPRG